ncbi:MAG TPA: oligosaccharide flippase family protein [Candidatus Limnocylindrales bacterium]
MTLIGRLRGAMPRGDAFRGAATIVAGTGAAQAIVVVTTPVLTRLYSPADYGILGVATSILFVLISVTCLRYDFAIPLPERDIDAANVLALSLVLNIATSAVVAVALLLAGTWLGGALGLSALGPLAALLAVAQLGGGVTSAFVNWALRSKDFRAIAVNRLTQSVALVSVQVGLGAAGLAAPGLFLGAVAGSVAGSTRLALTAWRRESALFRGVSVAGMVSAASRYRRFPIFSSGSAVLGALGVRAPLLLLVAVHGASVGGQYALAERVLYLPLTLVAGAVGQVFVADAARAARDEPDALVRLFRRTTRSLALMAIGPAIVIAVTAPFLTSLVFGAEWGDAGIYVAVLVPMFFVTFVSTATGNILYIVERQGLHLVREIVRLGLLAGSILVAARFGLPPIGTLIVLSVAGCVTYVLYWLLSWRAVLAFARSRDLSPPADGVVGVNPGSRDG